MTDLLIRTPTQNELDTICRDSWCTSFVRSSDAPRRMAKWMWARTVNAIVTELLSKNRVMVAALPDVPDEVVGWICWEPPHGRHRWCLHYCWVKRYAYGVGVEDELMRVAMQDTDDDGVQCSFRVPYIVSLMEGAVQ